MWDYRLYGLYKNPFDDHLLDAHLVSGVDNKLAAIFEQIRGGEGVKAGISLPGSEGYGRTETLLILKMKADKDGIYTIFSDAHDIPNLRDKIEKGSIGLKLKRKGDAKIEEVILLALNKHKPSLLLLDNLDEPELQNIVTAIFDKLESGTMIVFSCKKCEAHDFSVLELSPLTDEEAVLITEKRLALFRYSQKMNSLYPFTRGLICQLNQEVGGNPGSLIKRLDGILKDGIEKKIFYIPRL